MSIELGAWIGGRTVAVPDAVARIELRSPVDGSLSYRLPDAGADLVEAAVGNAAAAFEAHRHVPTATRIAWLEAMARTVAANTGPIVDSIVRAIGKPRRAATFEAGRVAEFLRGCVAELSTWRGELVPVDSVPLGAGHLGLARRIPCGVVGAITPFNAPANLLVQKIGPALATGNAVVVKPHPTGVETALLIAALCKEAGLPDGLFNVVPGDREAARALAAHPRVAVVSLTGGVAAAEALARAAGAKKFCAELGSSAANIVLADANLEDAAQKIARAGFEASGQQCISAQRIIVEQAVFGRFLELFVAAAKSLKVGLPEEAGRGHRADGERGLGRAGDGDGSGCRRPGRESRAATGTQWRCRLSRDSRVRTARVAPAVRGSIRPGGGGAAGAGAGRRHRTGQRLAVRTAGRMLYREPGCSDEGGRALRFGFGVDQRGEPVPARHVPVRRGQAVGLRPRRNTLRNGGVLAMEIRRFEIFGVTL